MSYPAPSSSLQPTERIDRGAIHDKSRQQSPHTALIDILDNDSLLHVFYLYRPAIFDGDRNDKYYIVAGKDWDSERWWYKLAHVCRRWRDLILGSTLHLDLCLVCTPGTPVADMLAHSPPLPLFIDYREPNLNIAEDEEGIILALKHRDRVRGVRFRMSIPIMHKLVGVIEEEYPVLEYLIMTPQAPMFERTTLILSETLQAPHLRHLSLRGFRPPIGPRLRTTAVGIVALYLHFDRSSAELEFQPHTLLQLLSFLQQLETLRIDFSIPILNEELESQLIHTPIVTHITFPNLRWFEFRGASAYMEAIVHRITAPLLEKLCIRLTGELFSLAVPGLLQFMNTAENFRFDGAIFKFSGYYALVELYLHEKAEVFVLSVLCWGLDIQVACLAQILNSLCQRLSTVEHLTLKHENSIEYKEIDVDRTDWGRTEWRDLLRSLSNVKTLHVDKEIVELVSDCLQVGDEEPSLELLPELRKLTYSASGETGGAFRSFVDARKNAGCPVSLICIRSRSATSLSRRSSQGSSESSSVIASGSSEAGSSEAENSEAGSNEAGSSEAGSDIDT